MNVGEKIKYQRKRLGLTQTELGDMIGVKKSSVAKWEKGVVTNLKKTTIAKLADIFEVKPSYFIMDDEKVYNDIEVSYVKVPLYETLCCGNGGFVDDNIIDMIPVPSKGLSKSAKYFAQYASGESMINARIHDGDIVFVKKTDIVENGEIAVVIIDDEATLKRFFYYREQNLVILKPENPKYQDIILTGEQLNQVRVIGRAVAFQSDVI